jgi:S1-C subfamily serine protease
MPRQTPFPPFGRQPEPEPEPPPTRLAIARGRLSRFYVRFRSLFLIFFGVLIALAAFAAYDATKPPPQRLTQRDIDAAVGRALASATPSPSYASQVFQVIRPSLVRVHALTSRTDPENGVGVGAGVVIDDSGIILSSLHVVAGALEVRVFFADGSESTAEIIVRQPENDLAILSANEIPDDLVPAVMGNSGALQVGDEVFPVGNPFGVSNSLSAGVVSGLGRSYRSPSTGDQLSNLIQFDAAVNPGNSGGPLLNRYGEVVGVVTGLLNPTEQEVFIGIGLAVPIETATAPLGSPPH